MVVKNVESGSKTAWVQSSVPNLPDPSLKDKDDNITHTTHTHTHNTYTQPYRAQSINFVADT